MTTRQHPIQASRWRMASMTGLLVFGLFISLGCQSAYYAGMEKMGYHKRDLMVSDVEKARDAQQEAKEQFKSALDRFTSVLNVKGGKLQEKYDTLNAEYEMSDAKAQAVSDRIASVEDVSEALFAEWEVELKEYTSANLRKSSQTKLTKTRTQYAKLIKAMKRAERKMPPVLGKFKDQVLFLKHNLNAQAITSLKGELGTVESNINALIKEMENSINQADAFISSMHTGQS